jgi:hypothetical protein
MNPTFRKVALIAATLGLLLSLFLALRPGDDDETAPPTTTAAETRPATTAEEPPPATTEEAETTTAPTTTAPPPEPAFDTVAVRVVGGQPQGGVVRATVEQGREIVLVVRSDVADHVHLHGYDLFADVAPGAPARLRFTADVPGRFEAELEDRGVPIADIQVRP